MPEIVIFNWDVANAIEYNPKNFKKPSFPVKVAIDPPAAILKQISNDPLLHQRIVDAVRAEFNKVGGRIDPKLRLADQQVGSARTTQAKSDIMNKFAQFAKAELSFGQRTAEQATRHVWESLANQRKEYTKYKFKTGFKISFGALGFGLSLVGTGGALLSVAPSAGASVAALALSLVSLLRSGVDLTKTLIRVSMEAEDVGKRLYSMLATLRGRYKTASRTGVASFEVTVSIINSLLQAEFSNISKAKSESGLYKNKLFGVRDTAHKLSKQLNQILEKSEPLERELLARAGDPKAAKALAALDKLRKQIAGDPPGARIQIKPGLLDKVTETHERAETGLLLQKLAEQGIRELQMKSPAWTGKFDKCLEVGVNLGFAVGGAATGGIFAKSVTDGVTVVLSAANDLASISMDVIG